MISELMSIYDTDIQGNKNTNPVNNLVTGGHHVFQPKIQHQQDNHNVFQPKIQHQQGNHFRSQGNVIDGNVFKESNINSNHQLFSQEGGQFDRFKPLNSPFETSQNNSSFNLMFSSPLDLSSFEYKEDLQGLGMDSLGSPSVVRNHPVGSSPNAPFQSSQNGGQYSYGSPSVVRNHPVGSSPNAPFQSSQNGGQYSYGSPSVVRNNPVGSSPNAPFQSSQNGGQYSYGSPSMVRNHPVGSLPNGGQYSNGSPSVVRHHPVGSSKMAGQQQGEDNQQQPNGPSDMAEQHSAGALEWQLSHQQAAA